VMTLSMHLMLLAGELTAGDSYQWWSCRWFVKVAS
jgi:hypothetical protein